MISSCPCANGQHENCIGCPCAHKVDPPKPEPKESTPSGE